MNAASSAAGENDAILDNINALVAEERALRERSTENLGLGADEQARLRSVEVRLDQCWDLLRQRRAKTEFGENPDEAAVRPPDEVEGYQG
ncbi:DUF2630 family protein [Streptomyces scopuliridis]|uniref:DUF2630 family protein n=1 Tax=Streptomyces scopuliridis TaxID=452529 RepID=A0ACD4ZP95_9ACTN|nr:DUF2630 family protein [Streptomyces scopuliridis]WSB34676.1 DUF2630 family protein [Streptomyces scopuliridis]WSB98926.1 DUF2630 family protein [Streptomyces scopuliridis]WSC07372.1 DUF2630 family protein [Streptomyces scopuliridis]